MGFFDPWKEDRQAMFLSSVMGITMLMIIFGLQVNFQGNSQEFVRSNIYVLMLSFAFMAGFVDWGVFKQQRSDIVEFVQFGSIKKLIFSGIAGIVFALLIAGVLFTAVPKAVTLTDVPPFLSTSFLTFFYIVIVASYVEEKFFACAIAPTAYKWMGGPIGLIFVSASFAYFHGFAYGWDYNQMLVAGVWRAAVLLGNQIFQSTGFSFLAHITNNYLAFPAGG